MRPPALHHQVVREVGHGVIAPPPEHAEKRVRLLVEMDGIVGDAGFLQQPDQLRPDLVVPPDIFGLHAGIELHAEGIFLLDHASRLLKKRFQTMGSAMTRMSSEPMKIDITMPGTLSRPSP